MAQAQVTPEQQAAQQLAKWFVSRIYGGDKADKKGGLGPSEFLKYANFKPDFIAPPRENKSKAVSSDFMPLWDKFFYLMGLIAMAKQEIWLSEKNEVKRASKLEVKIVEIFHRYLLIKQVPTAG